MKRNQQKEVWIVILPLPVELTALCITWFTFSYAVVARLDARLD